MGRPRRYAAEVRERAVRLVFDHAHHHDSQWAAIRSVADKIGCTSEKATNELRGRPGSTGEGMASPTGNNILYQVDLAGAARRR